MTLPALTAIGIILGSYHVDASRDYQQFNPGILVEAGANVASVYRNSNDRTTVLLGRRFAFNEHVGVMAAVCSGYRRPVCAAIYVRAGPLELAIIPIPNDGHKGALGLVFRTAL